MRPAQTESTPARENAQAPERPAPVPPRADGFPLAGSLIRLEPITHEQLQRIIAEQPLAEIIRAQLPALPAEVQQALAAALPIITAPQTVTPQTPVTTQTTLPSTSQTNPQTTFAQIQTPTQAILAVPVPGVQGDIQTQLSPQTFQNSQSALASPQIIEGEPLPSLITFPQGAESAGILQTLGRLLPGNTVVAPSSETLQQPFSQAFNARIAQIDAPLAQIVPPQSGEAPPLPKPFQNQSVEALQAGQLNGIITARTEAQIPVLTVFFPQSPGLPTEQNFLLTFPNENVALGTQIQLSPQAPALATILPQTSLASFLAPQPWPVMSEIYQTLTQIAPQTAQAMAATTPNPSASPAQFGAAALFFVSAVRGGDIQSWLGEKAVEALRDSGKGGLLTRLNNEGGLLSRVANDSVTQDWRAMHIPLFWEGEMHKIALHYRHEDSGQDRNQKDGNKGARFVFDLSLSEMGKVQIDGLFRPVSRDGPRLDVILRTEEHFSQSMQAEMRRLYTDALRPSQVGGELSFQIASEGWVTIQAEREATLGVEA